jgi:hypothetical protein
VNASSVNSGPSTSRSRMQNVAFGNAAWATRSVSAGTPRSSRGHSDISTIPSHRALSSLDNSVQNPGRPGRQRHTANSPAESEQAALKCLYLVTRSLDPTGTGRTRWTMRWKPALNAFAITFGDRFPAAEAS